MGRSLHKLTALKIQRLTAAGMHLDGGGLYLRISKAGTKSWTFRYKRRDMGLGAYPTISLAEARKRAADAREQLAAGIDPLDAKAAAARPAKPVVTFDEMAADYIAAHEAGWRNDKHRQQWSSTLATYAFPVIGKLDVAEVETAHVLEILRPIWATKSETAGRLRGRIEAVLDAAKAAGLREAQNPATWKGHLAHLLPARSRVRRVKHHTSLPYVELPAFMAALAKRPALAARALVLCIMTAARSGEVLGATWDEFDLERAVWTIPAGRMKNGAVHRVPLTAGAVAVLKELPRLADNVHVFPGERKGRPLSNMCFAMLLRRMNRGDLTAHGMRSSFRVWAAECTTYPREIVEMALSHTVGSAVERAYQRSDLFEKRRELMDEWSKYLRQTDAGLIGNGV